MKYVLIEDTQNKAIVEPTGVLPLGFLSLNLLDILYKFIVWRLRESVDRYRSGESATVIFPGPPSPKGRFEVSLTCAKCGEWVYAASPETYNDEAVREAVEKHRSTCK
jgi:hypothetical protein